MVPVEDRLMVATVLVVSLALGAAPYDNGPQLLAQLGDDSYFVRRAAHQHLVRRGEGVRFLLNRGVGSTDLEVRRRCERMLYLLGEECPVVVGRAILFKRKDTLASNPLKWYYRFSRSGHACWGYTHKEINRQCRWTWNRHERELIATFPGTACCEIYENWIRKDDHWECTARCSISGEWIVTIEK